jgi:hypothetical protein
MPQSFKYLISPNHFRGHRPSELPPIGTDFDRVVVAMAISRVASLAGYREEKNNDDDAEESSTYRRMERPKERLKKCNTMPAKRREPNGKNEELISREEDIDEPKMNGKETLESNGNGKEMLEKNGKGAAIEKRMMPIPIAGREWRL